MANRQSDWTVACQRCGHEWVPNVPDPRECPRCKSYHWKRPLNRFSRRGRARI
jgi:predicted Zn-ribbon and HTH transcriptional regulator